MNSKQPSQIQIRALPITERGFGLGCFEFIVEKTTLLFEEGPTDGLQDRTIERRVRQMNKAEFSLIAEVIRKSCAAPESQATYKQSHRFKMAKAFADRIQEKHPRFDRNHFYVAAGVYDYFLDSSAIDRRRSADMN